MASVTSRTNNGARSHVSGLEVPPSNWLSNKGLSLANWSSIQKGGFAGIFMNLLEQCDRARSKGLERDNRNRLSFWKNKLFLNRFNIVAHKSDWLTWAIKAPFFKIIAVTSCRRPSKIMREENLRKMQHLFLRLFQKAWGPFYPNIHVVDGDTCKKRCKDLEKRDGRGFTLASCWVVAFFVFFFSLPFTVGNTYSWMSASWALKSLASR